MFKRCKNPPPPVTTPDVWFLVLRQVSALNAKVDAMAKSDQVTQLENVLTKFISDVNTKLAELSAKIAALQVQAVALPPEDAQALADLTNTVTNADNQVAATPV